MAVPSKRKAAAKGSVAAESPSPSPPAIDRAGLQLADLAKAVLAGAFKARVGEIRRLAEGVLAGKSKKKKPKKGTEKKAGSKKRKLSKIPGQKPGK